MSVSRPIVASQAPRRKVGTGTAFKDFSYCEIRYQLSPKSPDTESWGCADTGSGMSLVDESVLESGALSSRKRTIKSPVHLKGIGDELYLSKESVVLDVFFPDITKTRLAKITREFHIVQDMDCGLLIGNDIIEPEGIIMDLAKKRMEITSCNKMRCQLKVRRKKQKNHVTVRSAITTVLLPQCGKHIPIRFPQLGTHDIYDVHPYVSQRDIPKGCYAMRDNRLCADKPTMWVVNVGKGPAVISKDTRLGYNKLPDSPQYTPVKPVDVVQCHFRKAAEPQEL
jgi:hypothetical protein